MNKTDINCLNVSVRLGLKDAGGYGNRMLRKSRSLGTGPCPWMGHLTEAGMP